MRLGCLCLIFCDESTKTFSRQTFAGEKKCCVWIFINRLIHSFIYSIIHPSIHPSPTQMNIYSGDWVLNKYLVSILRCVRQFFHAMAAQQESTEYPYKSVASLPQVNINGQFIMILLCEPQRIVKFVYQQLSMFGTVLRQFATFYILRIHLELNAADIVMTLVLTCIDALVRTLLALLSLSAISAMSLLVLKW